MEARRVPSANVVGGGLVIVGEISFSYDSVVGGMDARRLNWKPTETGVVLDSTGAEAGADAQCMAWCIEDVSLPPDVTMELEPRKDCVSIGAGRVSCSNFS